MNITQESKEKMNITQESKKRGYVLIDIPSKFLRCIIILMKLHLKGKHLHKFRTLHMYQDQLNTFRLLKLLLLGTRQYKFRKQHNRHQLRKP